jgi:hypothetical protein
MKALLADAGQDLQRVVNQCSLIGGAQNAQRAAERYTPALHNRPALPFSHDEKIRPLFSGELNGFPFAAIESGDEFGIRRGLERMNTQPGWRLCDPGADL